MKSFVKRRRGATGMRTEKILVVDDDAAVRRLIWKALQSTGILIYQSESIEKQKISCPELPLICSF